MSSNLLERWPKHREKDDTQLDLSLGMSLATNYKVHQDDYDRRGSTSVSKGSRQPVEFPPRVRLGDVMHPWSLAARQEQAVLEQMHVPVSAVAIAGRASSSSTPAGTRVGQAASAVGWPPVRAHRRIVISLYSPKRHIEHVKSEEKDAKKLKSSKNEISLCKKMERKPTKFVKVNIQGFAVGRKIDLMDQDGYDSLSRTLHRMFDNFLSVKDVEMESKGIISSTPKLFLLYEDSEGDRMLVGDVPWEMFIRSAKRLYLSRCLQVCHQEAEDKAK